MGHVYQHFTLEDRIEIARLQGEGRSIRQIASALDRAPSSVSRELKRNRAAQAYRPSYADQLGRARRWTGSKLDRNQDLRELVLSRLRQGHSPEQIAGRLLRDKASQRISHETIYRFVHAQIARHNDYSWRHFLPRGKSRRGWHRGKGSGAQAIIKDRVSIAQRPRFIAARKQSGHWEADLMVFGDKKSNILLTQERSTRYVRLFKQPDRTAKRVSANLRHWFRSMPGKLRRSLTQDNGLEFILHHKLNTVFNLKTYFCDVHSPWQKGGIENLNGRIRRYLPRATDFKSITPKRLKRIEKAINNTPRKCLGFKTPAELFNKQVLHFKCESTTRPFPE
jgi:transposase, IS30 family